MNIALIGCGGRELAICNALKKVHREEIRVICIGSHDNPGIQISADQFIIGNVKEHCNVLGEEIHLCVIGPEKYIAEGIADICVEKGIPVFGPTKEAAKLETSKTFTRKLLHHRELCCYSPEWRAFPKYSEANQETKKSFHEYIQNGNIVIKADGLHGGKGVFIGGDHFQTIEEAERIWETINDEILIEERLVGEEFSLMSFTDGETCYHMPIVRDYKRVGEGNTGPNTGGMGSISFADHSMPFLSSSDVSMAQKLNESVMEILSKRGVQYRGVLYGGFMKTNSGEIKLIEYNCRFGDPEVLNVLHLLESDLLSVFWHAARGELSKIPPPLFRNEATYCRYYCPPNYPNASPETSTILDFELVNFLEFADIIFANVARVEHRKNLNLYHTLGSRSFAIVCSGESIGEAENRINEKEKYYPVSKLVFRKDIGHDITENESYLNHLQESGDLINSLKSCIVSSWTPQVMSRFGDYAGIYNLGGKHGSCLVTSVDGVGTKPDLVRAIFGDTGFESLGHDLVNHCVNDILVKGARPLFFTDYFASAKLSRRQMFFFLKGISEACRRNGFCLISGESAEMQGTYLPGKVDLVGNIVGIVNERDIIDGKRDIQKGDVIFGLYSSGPHTNGYTVIRKMVQTLGGIDSIPFQFRNTLVAPHKSYLEVVNSIRNIVKINGLIHITGGGFVDNPPRVLPEGLVIEYNEEFEFTPFFNWIQERLNISDDEMMRIFNCGYGMLVVVPREDSEKISQLFGHHGKIIGDVVTL